VGVRGLDHLAITVDDVERTLAFYRRVLDAQPLFEELWRAGRIPVVLLQVGASRLSVHSAKAPAAPHARVPLPGSQDFCFRWDGPIESAEAHLRERGVEIALGPVPRPAADGAAGQSVYFRDPDGNLLELLTTDPSPV
jgi:catechol 2,3-dioxygenase-like lactoylglutathione lyase family enzyme